MKIIFNLLFFLFLTSMAFAQYKDRPVTEGVTKITFLEPGIAHEFPLGTSTTFFLRGGMTASLALDDYYYDDIKVLFRLFAASSFRAYYNFRKRELLEKNTAKNSANYVALLAILASPPLNKGNDYDPTYNNTLLNTGVVWGMQRNYPSGFSLDLNIGLGYVKSGSDMLISPVGELNIGWWLGKNRDRR
jgi:hypothetical protein